MKKLLTATAVAVSLAFGGTAVAGHKHGNKKTYEDTARVVSAKPIYRTVRVSTPHKECWREKVRGHRQHGHHSADSYTAPIAGAIIGGVIGNQFGGGSGKDALTVGGALLGASVGNDMRSNYRHHTHGPRFKRRCETTYTYNTREELDGYRVKYRYNGEVYHTRMDHHPGDTIRVRVSVRPIG